MLLLLFDLKIQCVFFECVFRVIFSSFVYLSKRTRNSWRAEESIDRQMKIKKIRGNNFCFQLFVAVIQCKTNSTVVIMYQWKYKKIFYFCSRIGRLNKYALHTLPYKTQLYWNRLCWVNEPRRSPRNTNRRSKNFWARPPIQANAANPYIHTAYMLLAQCI